MVSNILGVSSVRPINICLPRVLPRRLQAIWVEINGRRSPETSNVRECPATLHISSVGETVAPRISVTNPYLETMRRCVKVALTDLSRGRVRRQGE